MTRNYLEDWKNDKPEDLRKKPSKAAVKKRRRVVNKPSGKKVVIEGEAAKWHEAKERWKHVNHDSDD